MQKTHFNSMMAEIEDSDSEDNSSEEEEKVSESKYVLTPKSNASKCSFRDESSSDEEKSRQRSHRAVAKVAMDAEYEESKATGSPTLTKKLSTDEIFAMKRFITRPVQKNERMVQCFVERSKSGLNMLKPVYKLYLTNGKQFLLAAQKRSGNKTSNYLIAMDKSPSDRRSNLVVGKLRANTFGSEYLIYDHGLNPKKTALESSTRQVLGFFGYQYDKMGPGKLLGCVPRLNDVDIPTVIKDEETSNVSDMFKTAIGKGKTDKVMIIRNKPPKYDEKVGGHVLNFGGRITMSSVKNFQLECDDTNEETILQFGRVSCPPSGPTAQCGCHKDIFNLDFKYPLSPLQAFAIILSTLDKKVADSKGFETMNKLASQFSKH